MKELSRSFHGEGTSEEGPATYRVRKINAGLVGFDFVGATGASHGMLVSPTLLA